MLSMTMPALTTLSHIFPEPTALINDPKHISMLNLQNATWVAGVNERFAGMDYRSAQPLMGAALEDNRDLPPEAFLPATMRSGLKAADIPKDFDARAKWPGLIHSIRDQQRCGSCWAFSAVEVLADRAAIAAGKSTPPLSPEDLVSCDKIDMGCNGGRLATAWSYLKSSGAVTESCFPYAAGNGTAPACPSRCADSEAWAQAKTKAKSTYAVDGDITEMQKEIMTNGPIQVAFSVFKSFMSYKSGVYSKHFWEVQPQGGHAVKIIGWGTEPFWGTQYWLVANSWNTNWGMDGYFKIKAGVNECGVEAQPHAGLPAVA